MSSEPDKGLKVVGWQKDGDDSFDRDVIIFDDGSLWKHDGNEWYRIWQPDSEPSEPTVDDPEPENIPRHWFVSPNPKFRNPDDVQRIHELEARVAELEAMGGVAWALRKESNGYISEWISEVGGPALFAQREFAEKHAEQVSFDGCLWEPVPYHIGSAAEAIKAANERAEKAEARVKELEKHLDVAQHANGECHENNLKLQARVKELEAELAAAKAEPVKLDPARVIATASHIAFRKSGRVAGAEYCRWIGLYLAIRHTEHTEGWDEAKPYELAE